MTTLELAWMMTGVYLCGWLSTSRWLFRRWWRMGNWASKGKYCQVHGEHVKQSRWISAKWKGGFETEKGHYEYYSARQLGRSDPKEVACCFNHPTQTVGEYTFSAMGTALAWPMVFLVALVRFAPPLTYKQLKVEEEKHRKRIKELEDELGRTV